MKTQTHPIKTTSYHPYWKDVSILHRSCDLEAKELAESQLRDATIKFERQNKALKASFKNARILFAV